ncbi:MAG: ABC transporter permease [Fimbriimonas sp.]
MTIRIVALILAAIAILGFAVAYAGASPLGAAQTLFEGSLGNARVISGTLKEATPLLITGLAVFLALRAGLFNIGVEGQLLVGAATAAAVGLRLPGMGGVLLGIVLGMVAGALWALPAALIKAYRNGHEVITTIMLNNIAGLLTAALVAGPLKDPTQEAPTTAVIATRLPPALTQSGLTISSALVLGLIVVAAVAFWLKRTVAGYEMQAVGANATAARFAGVHPPRVMVKAMLASGAIAGMGGALQVLAYEGRFYSGFSPGYGFDGLGIALLAGNSALGVIPGAFLFGALAKGGVSLGIAGIPKGITTVVIGLVILVAAVLRYREVKTVA